MLIRRCIFLLSLLFLYYQSYSQDLTQSRTSSYFTYIFRVNDKEAKKIYKKDIWEIEESFFHTKVDSFPTDSAFNRQLDPGHYLKVFTDKERLKIDITTIHRLDVHILKNNTDLVVQVYDTLGIPVSNAKVKVRSKKLRYDAKTRSYIDRRSNQKGILEVDYNGSVSYYKLHRLYNNSTAKRYTQKLIYSTPVKYVWLPVRYVIYLPIDGAKSIIHGWPQGTISRTGRFFVNAFESIAGIFDDYYRDEYKFTDRYKGYLVFNKPKYQPGDTVRFKAYILKKNGKPLNSEVDVTLKDYPNDRVFAKIKPYREGGYSYKFYLHDSLGLDLDQSYYISLNKSKYLEYISERFIYEDYELSKLKLDLKPQTEKLHKGDTLVVEVKGTDENDLSILDGRIEVLITPENTEKNFARYLYIPDTLAFFTERLNTEGVTKVKISDELFPEANLSFKLKVDLYTSDNEMVSDECMLKYTARSAEISHSLINDSILISYLKDGNQRPVSADVLGVDNFGHKTLLYHGSLPQKLKLLPYHSGLLVRTDSLDKEISISSEQSLLQCFSERSSDSLWVRIDNPRDLPFTYFVYRRNKEIFRGYSDSLELSIKSDSKDLYYISVQYLWGGTVTNVDYRIPFNRKEIKIEVSEPGLVYPGQSTKIDILVTDNRGNQVPGVDLTAYSLTSKFDYSPPKVPEFERKQKTKNLINNFRFQESNDYYDRGLRLDFDSWRKRAGLDSIEYYKFLYPKHDLYQSTLFTADSITQFAPYIVSNGERVPIHIIYIDNKPVYFSWATIEQPYSFRVDSGSHSMILRTHNREYTIDSVYFTQKMKTLICIEEGSQLSEIEVEEKDAMPDYSEKWVLGKYMFPFRKSFAENWAFIEQGNNVQLLKPRMRYSEYNIAGPINGNFLRFELLDKYDMTLVHEPGFEYEFSHELLKMRSIDKEDIIPRYFQSTGPIYPIDDIVLSKEQLLQDWMEFKNTRRYNSAKYNNPRTTEKGKGMLIIDRYYKDSDINLSNRPLNTLIFKYDDPKFLRVYPGSRAEFHNLESGFYKLLFFFAGSDYSIVDSLYIERDGINIHKIGSEVFNESIIKSDSYSIEIGYIIENSLFGSQKSSSKSILDLSRLSDFNKTSLKYVGDGVIVSGYIYDAEDSLEIPGVMIQIDDTPYGTVSDIDGFYSIKVPSGKTDLTFMFIGMKPHQLNIEKVDSYDVFLEADIMALQEVVVMGYGSRVKKSVTGSVTTVEMHGLTQGNEVYFSLSGKVAGLQISSPGAAGQIRIRGTGTISADNSPLYVIDGMVYTGDISQIDPAFLTDVSILKGEEATSLYGSRATNGVVIINTKGTFAETGAMNSLGADFDKDFLEASTSASSIRNNFSDYAFWQPRLVTDDTGRSSFDVTFPDDVTSWRTFYLATNGKKQSVQTEGLIKSYKPVMAQLSLPRFLLEGDTASIIGKVLNYTSDTLGLTTYYEINDSLLSEKKLNLIRSNIDTFSLSTSSLDSLKLKFYLQKEDGYLDGEEKSIPVFPVGLEESVGKFLVLDKDTTFSLSFDEELGKVSLYAKSDVLEAIKVELGWLINYKYSCNEQLASKLKGLLADRSVSLFQGNKFNRDRHVNRIISNLEKNRKVNGLWGWWKSSKNESLWISLHVLEALLEAQKEGYRVDIEMDNIWARLLWELDSMVNTDEKIRILNIFSIMDATVDYNHYIVDIERSDTLSLNQRLRIIELKQINNLDHTIDTLWNYKKETMFGNLYFSDDTIMGNLLYNDIQNTIISYRIIRNDSSLSSEESLRKIRNYFFEKRMGGYWLNTYESSRIIETILPDLLLEGDTLSKPRLTLSGMVNETIEDFPYDATFFGSGELVIEKTGDFPVYLSAHQRFWNMDPLLKDSDFIIRTSFEDIDSTLVLQSGREVKLVVDLEVKKDADYVMINVPIPAGCSYAEKGNSFRNEVHREYFKNETSIFCEKLDKGIYTFEIKLMPRYTGSYTLNPAKVELMYFPTFNANDKTKRAIIK